MSFYLATCIFERLSFGMTACTDTAKALEGFRKNPAAKTSAEGYVGRLRFVVRGRAPIASRQHMVLFAMSRGRQPPGEGKSSPTVPGHRMSEVTCYLR